LVKCFFKQIIFCQIFPFFNKSHSKVLVNALPHVHYPFTRKQEFFKNMQVKCEYIIYICAYKRMLVSSKAWCFHSTNIFFLTLEISHTSWYHKFAQHHERCHWQI
jgi:hypothetical protein